MLLAAAMAKGGGDDSDEEVYAAAKAAEQGTGLEYDSDDNPIVSTFMYHIAHHGCSSEDSAIFVC
jgi:hypothetical protein